jgi:hypothetical protein
MPRTADEERHYQGYVEGAKFTWDQLNMMLGLIGLYQTTLQMQRADASNRRDLPVFEYLDFQWQVMEEMAKTIKTHMIVHTSEDADRGRHQG